MDGRRRYLELLRLEIDDLAEDIGALERATEGRRARGEITEYVLRENVAVLERESHGVAAVRACLEHVRAEDYACLEELMRAIGERLRDRIRCGGFEGVVQVLVERKLAKVASYVTRTAARPGV